MLDDASRCRQRAEQCRELASSIENAAEIEQLILLAVEFDVQAAAMEFHAAAQQREQVARKELVS